MAWIESHQSLLTHRKTLRASAQLKVSRHLLIGHLHALWWWALDNADDNGDLGEALDEELAEAAGWPARRAHDFVEALVSVHFLDRNGARLSLHNWWNYAGKLNDKRSKDRARKAERAATSGGIPLEVAAKSQAPTTPTNQPNQPTNHTNPADEAAGMFARFGKVTMGTREAINFSVKEYGGEWVLRAVKDTAGASLDSAPTWSYVEAILERFKAQGGPDEPKQFPKAGRHSAGRNPGGQGPDMGAVHALIAQRDAQRAARSASAANG